MIFLLDFLTPKYAEAAETLRDLMLKINTIIINPLVGFLFAVAFVLFLWGIARYFLARGSNPTMVGEAKSHMLWGIVGMFIMFSVFGIMRLIANSLGVSVN
jgi:hypothetical protein